MGRALLAFGAAGASDVELQWKAVDQAPVFDDLENVAIDSSRFGPFPRFFNSLWVIGGVESNRIARDFLACAVRDHQSGDIGFSHRDFSSLLPAKHTTGHRGWDQIVRMPLPITPDPERAPDDSSAAYPEGQFQD